MARSVLAECDPRGPAERRSDHRNPRRTTLRAALEAVPRIPDSGRKALNAFCNLPRVETREAYPDVPLAASFRHVRGTATNRHSARSCCGQKFIGRERWRQARPKIVSAGRGTELKGRNVLVEQPDQKVAPASAFRPHRCQMPIEMLTFQETGDESLREGRRMKVFEGLGGEERGERALWYDQPADAQARGRNLRKATLVDHRIKLIHCFEWQGRFLVEIDIAV